MTQCPPNSPGGPPALDDPTHPIGGGGFVLGTHPSAAVLAAVLKVSGGKAWAWHAASVKSAAAKRKDKRFMVCIINVSRSAEEFRLTKNNRSEEHTSELQSQSNLVCRLLLEKKKIHRLAVEV